MWCVVLECHTHDFFRKSAAKPDDFKLFEFVLSNKDYIDTFLAIRVGLLSVSTNNSVLSDGSINGKGSVYNCI